MARSRSVIFLASLAVGLGVLAALGALYLYPARAAVGPLLAEGLVLPADTRFLIGLDVRRLAASALYQRHGKSSSRLRPEAFRELERRTGLNPERDLDRVVIAGRAGEQPGGLALVQGRFDRTQLSRAIETGGGSSVTWKSHAGSTVYLFSEGRKGTLALAFLNDATLAFGDAAGVEAALAAHAEGRQPLRGNAALMPLLEAVKPGCAFWMVGDQSLLARLPRAIPAPGARGREGLDDQVKLPALKSLLVTGELEGLLSLEVTGEAGDEAAARNLADVARGFVALLALQGQQKPELKELAAAFSIVTEESRVRLSARIPYETLEALESPRTRDKPAEEPGK